MAPSGGSVLIVDPDEAAVSELALVVERTRAQVHVACRGREALRMLETHPAEVVFTALNLPDMTGVELVVALADAWPGLPVVVVAEGASVAGAVNALKAGAADFLEKPYHPDQIAYALNKVLTAVRSNAPRPAPPPSSARVKLLGESPAMHQAHATLRRAAQGNATVLVRGESGTGKELVARAIHEASPRGAQAFVKIDCAALPENLLASELFGYERGAFTGAVSRKPGRVELADKGTLFLDEVGELGLSLQAKLLRLLQDRQFERLGGTKTIDVDLRVVAATHRDLEGMIERGQFRLDLFYRINVVPLWLPPLRARREDITLLATHFCRVSGAANGKPDVRIDEDGLDVLRRQRWPGNVRQLQNFVERLVVLSTHPVIGKDEVQGELGRNVQFKTQTGTTGPGTTARAQPTPGTGTPTTGAAVLPLAAEVHAAERRALQRALEHCKGNRSLAARLLGVSRSTLYAKLQEHGLL